MLCVLTNMLHAQTPDTQPRDERVVYDTLFVHDTLHVRDTIILYYNFQPVTVILEFSP